MALALRLFLLLLLAAALPDRAAQAAPQRAWRADWDRDMEYIKKMVNGGLKTIPDAGGPPTWTNQDKEDQKSLEASQVLDRMLNDLKRRRELKKMALLKAVFPEGNTGPWAASAAGREAMPGTVPGDEGAETASPAAGMEDGLEPLGGSAGVSAERTYSAPFLIPESKLSSHRRGPPRGRNKPTEGIKSLETSKHMDVRLSDRDRRREMDQKSLQKAELPAECNSFIPDASTEREEIADSATEDVISETGVYVEDPVRLPRIVCPQDIRRSCMIGTVVTLITVPLVLIFCYFGIQKVYEIRRSSSSYLI
ncbi:uncharacterized protein LOC111944509 [Cyanistes caeruleus]|uniref:uncharacterized protein LOC111944509 n=1 Tax=Cyanistes caeruleus TaxID=156563 RepID=UPI000CDAC992|nr:uncharacterized protein LOC111944509 [Cyanistes caeruleus]